LDNLGANAVYSEFALWYYCSYTSKTSRHLGF
jgi:hypothetical protein